MLGGLLGPEGVAFIKVRNNHGLFQELDGVFVLVSLDAAKNAARETAQKLGVVVTILKAAEIVAFFF